MGGALSRQVTCFADGRADDLLSPPPTPKWKVAVVEFDPPGAPHGGEDKAESGFRLDTIPIVNGIIKAGGYGAVIKYAHAQHDEFVESVKSYDAFIVRIDPAHLRNASPAGTAERFHALLNHEMRRGALVWSSPYVQTMMEAKDALVKIKHLSTGLSDTFAYASRADMYKSFRRTMAHGPRVIKPALGSGGEGVWLCWLVGKEYCANLGDASLSSKDKLKLMEMNDNHVEFHTVAEFVEFCAKGRTKAAGEWASASPGAALTSDARAGQAGLLVDQRFLPRIVEGEVRMLMVTDKLHLIVRKRPEGGLSATGEHGTYTYYAPGASSEYASLEAKFVGKDVGQLRRALAIYNEPLPLLWTADFIAKGAAHVGVDGGGTEYVVSEFNCSCVGIPMLMQAQHGATSAGNGSSDFAGPRGPRALRSVPDADFREASKLADFMGARAMETLEQQHLRTSSRFGHDLMRGA